MKPKKRQLMWISECQTALQELQKAFMAAPALGLSVLAKPFELFAPENQQCFLLLFH